MFVKYSDGTINSVIKADELNEQSKKEVEKVAEEILQEDEKKLAGQEKN